MMMLGWDVTPVDFVFSAPPKEEKCATDYAEEWPQKIRYMHEKE